MQRFVGIVHKGDDTDYGICFPDFEGCISAGSTVDELVEMAHEALQGHIDVMVTYGDPLPTQPISFEDATKHEFAKDAVLFLSVYAQLPSKAKRINITMDENLLHDIEQVATNRSAFLAEAAREKLLSLTS